MKTVTYCDKCLNEIKNLGEDSLQVFIVISSFYLSHKLPFCFCDIDDNYLTESIALLEKNGFVVSTDISDYGLAVLPLGHYVSEYSDFVKVCFED